MDSYVVRIYRRSSSSPQNLVGLVELVEVNQERVFSSFDELRAILSCRQGCIVRDENAGGEKSGEERENNIDRYYP